MIKMLNEAVRIALLSVVFIDIKRLAIFIVPMQFTENS